MSLISLQECQRRMETLRERHEEQMDLERDALKKEKRIDVLEMENSIVVRERVAAEKEEMLNMREAMIQQREEMVNTREEEIKKLMQVYEVIETKLLRFEEDTERNAKKTTNNNSYTDQLDNQGLEASDRNKK